MKMLIGVLILSVLNGCASSDTSSTAPALRQPVVTQYGEMRSVMREGRTELRIALADAVAAPHAIAVGAIEGLAGEVTIVDGEVWVSRVEDGSLRPSGPVPGPGDRATLLTLAHVGAWRAVPIQSSATEGEFEAFVEHAARSRGVDTTRPFPFLIEGTLTDIEMHVINGVCPHATDPETVDAQPWRWSGSQATDVLIVGFYAPNAVGVMTHHGSLIHAHVVLSLDGSTVTGHVDRVVVAPGMSLRIPDVRP
jgi:acetolactate decarboxylase